MPECVVSLHPGAKQLCSFTVNELRSQIVLIHGSEVVTVDLRAEEGTRCADAPPPQFPFVCLLVSGGHNLLLLVHGVGDYTLLGTTVDDAMGAPRPGSRLLSLFGPPIPWLPC